MPRSGIGLNELLGRKVAEVEGSGRVSARDTAVLAYGMDSAKLRALRQSDAGNGLSWRSRSCANCREQVCAQP